MRLAKLADMFLEGMHGMMGRQFPAGIAALLPDELVNPLVHGQIELRSLPLKRLPDLHAKRFHRWAFLAPQRIYIQESDNFCKVSIDHFGRDMLAVFRPWKHPDVIPVVCARIVPDGRYPLLR